MKLAKFLFILSLLYSQNVISSDSISIKCTGKVLFQELFGKTYGLVPKEKWIELGILSQKKIKYELNILARQNEATVIMGSGNRIQINESRIFEKNREQSSFVDLEHDRLILSSKIIDNNVYYQQYLFLEVSRIDGKVGKFEYQANRIKDTPEEYKAFKDRTINEGHSWIYLRELYGEGETMFCQNMNKAF